MLRPKQTLSLTGLLLLLLLAGCSDDGHSTVEEEVQAPCNTAEEDIQVNATATNIEFVRTPDACFDNLDGYPFTPSYVEIEGLRYHYVDEGPRDGEVILMLHGQPSWSYLYRKMIPVLAEAGYRVIAPDHIGMGRSDKPVDPRVHQFEQHVAWMKSFVSELGLTDITLFVQDWGSQIGLRMAGDNPEKLARIVVANGDLARVPEGLNPFTIPVFEFDETIEGTNEYLSQGPTDRVGSFQHWVNFAATAPHLFAADIIDISTGNKLTEAQFASYNAPYPARIYWGGIRAFPSMVAGFGQENFPAYEALGRFDRPFMFIGGENDANLGSVANQNKWIAHVPGAVGQPHTRYEAGHFIQEEVGEDMAEHVVAFLQANPIPVAGPDFLMRFCEIQLPFITDEGIRVRVYGTQQLNDCPQDAWDAIDPQVVAAEFGALTTIMNGPRYWVVDEVEIGEGGFNDNPPPGVGEIFAFGDLGLELRLVTSIIPPSGGNSGPYSVSSVLRNTIFHFVAGRRVYELEDPEGRRYLMQTFSEIVDPVQQLHDLVRLGDRLELPEGWQFRTYILEEPFELPTVDGIAELVQDELSNTYQRIP